MPIGQLIALGIGSPANINQLVLAGLYNAPVGGQGIQTGQILLGVVPTTLTGNVIYITPSRNIDIEWYSATAAILEGSLDQTNWVTVDTNAGGVNQQIKNSVWPYVRPSATVTILCRKAKKL